MNKIIELLIEYDGGDYVKNGLSISEKIKFEDYVSLTYYKDMTYEIISKGYEFIKWLINNDKIDYKKLHGEEWYLPLVDIVKFDGSKRLEVLLMLLAIQDKPLDFLTSILK